MHLSASDLFQVAWSQATAWRWRLWPSTRLKLQAGFGVDVGFTFDSCEDDAGDLNMEGDKQTSELSVG